MKAIDKWFQMMISDYISQKNISGFEKSLGKEYPKICSLIMERTCNLNCKHCFFQKEKSSRAMSENKCLEQKVLNIVSQLPKKSFIVHEGRILQEWHIPVMKKIKELRPDIQIGLLDNGSYFRHEKSLKENNLLFDWIDISLDGMKKAHNLQRNSNKSFEEAIVGLREARSYAKKVTSLFTLTKINFFDFEKTANYLLDNNLVHEIHVTSASEVVTKGSRFILDDYDVFWNQYRKVSLDREGKIFLRFYKLEDLKKFILTTGGNKIEKDSVLVDSCCVSFLIDSFRVEYVPMSMCIAETFLIDADATYRLPYCMQYKLEELTNNKNYNVSELEVNSNFRELYSLGAKKWFSLYGKGELKKEHLFLSNLFNLK